MRGVLPERLATLFKLALSTTEPGEAFNALTMLKRSLAAAGHDLHSAVDVFVASIVPDQESSPQWGEADDDHWLAVRSVTLFRHEKATGGYPCVRVEYLTRIGGVFDWWHPERPGHPRNFAHQKWRALGGGLPLPDTVDEMVAHQDELAQEGVEIQVDTSGRFPQVVAVRVRAEVAA